MRICIFFSAFGFHAGWEQPHFFATQGELKTTPVCYTRKHYHDAVGREVDAIRERVGVADLTPFGKFTLEGPGATQFLSSMVANTLPKVSCTCVFFRTLKPHSWGLDGICILQCLTSGLNTKLTFHTCFSL